MFIFDKLYGKDTYDRTNYTDKIGSKWCYPTDWDLTEDSDYGSINFESNGIHQQIYLKNLLNNCTK